MPRGCVIYIPQVPVWPLVYPCIIGNYRYRGGVIHTRVGLLRCSFLRRQAVQSLKVWSERQCRASRFFCVLRNGVLTLGFVALTVLIPLRAMSVAKQDTSQIKSKERVAERGEVFTAEREVNAMCDLVANECLRPDSRFLEPACGDGNFLAVILKRKLAELRRKYKKSPRDYEKQAIVAIASLYGVDIMNDNVIACRERLYKIWSEEYTDHCKNEASDEARDAAKFIISRNIINGNALTLMCVDAEGKDTSAPIVFSEWTLIGGTQMQRSDYTMSDLLLYNDNSEGYLFALTEEQKEEGGIFLRRYITHYKKVQDYGE